MPWFRLLACPSVIFSYLAAKAWKGLCNTKWASCVTPPPMSQQKENQGTRKKHRVMLLFATSSEQVRSWRLLIVFLQYPEHSVMHQGNQVFFFFNLGYHRVRRVTCCQINPSYGEQTTWWDCQWRLHEGKNQRLLESRFIGRKPWESGCELFMSETFLARTRSQSAHISSSHLLDLMVPHCSRGEHFARGGGANRQDWPRCSTELCSFQAQTTPKALWKYKATTPLCCSASKVNSPGFFHKPKLVWISYGTPCKEFYCSPLDF